MINDTNKKTKLNMVKMKVNIDYYKAKYYLEGLGTLSAFQVMRVLALVNCCAKSMTAQEQIEYSLPNGSHWASSNFLQLYYKDYLKLLELIEGNELITFNYKEKINKHTGEVTIGCVRIATINPKYIKECEVELSQIEYKHMIIHPRKLSKLGNLHSTNENIKINLSYSEFNKIVSDHMLKKDPNKSPEQLQQDLNEQWRVISSINRSGHIEPHMTIHGRNSSRITRLSHPCNDFITIDGEETIELDQHATYLTLLPEVLNKRISYKNDTFVNELENLRLLIKNTPNLYVHISNCIGVDMLEIKKEVNKFFCDPKANRTYDYKFFKFFNSYYPELTKSINYLRCKKGPYSEFNKIESFIFSGAAKDLIKMGISALTKYDSLIIKIKDLEIAKKVLNERFIKARVSNKTKQSKNLDNNLISSLSVQNQNGDYSKELREEPRDSSRGTRGAEVADRETHCPQNESLSVQNELLIPTKVPLIGTNKTSLSVQTRNKPTTITTLTDGRFRISIKNKKYNSKKNETLDQFKNRILELTGLKI